MQLRPICAVTKQQDEHLRSSLSLELCSSIQLSAHSLFDAAAEYTKPLLLAEHYRCPPPLAQMISELFYEGKLKIKSSPPHSDALLFIEHHSSWERTPKGILNHQEAHKVVDLIMENPHWIKEGLGVVTPFRAQADLIKGLLEKQIRDASSILVDTAHRFQGEERPTMLCSLVLTSTASKMLIQFAADPNLLNVALSRASSRLWIVGSPSLGEASELFLALFSYLNDRTNRTPKESSAAPSPGSN